MSGFARMSEWESDYAAEEAREEITQETLAEQKVSHVSRMNRLLNEELDLNHNENEGN